MKKLQAMQTTLRAILVIARLVRAIRFLKDEDPPDKPWDDGAVTWDDSMIPRDGEVVPWDDGAIGLDSIRSLDDRCISLPYEQRRPLPTWFSS
jgi:hypothetical protein